MTHFSPIADEMAAMAAPGAFNDELISLPTEERNRS